MKHYLSICAIFRNEARFLPEWIAFHRAVGVDHFYLYNNRSTDNPEAILEPLVAAGYVTVIPWPVDYDQGAQRQAYTDGLARTRGQSRWVAFLDIDEFLLSPVHTTLPPVLREYERYPGVAVHWQVYGSSGLDSLEGGLVTEKLVRRGPTQWVRNRRVKLILDPERAEKPESAHQFLFRDGKFAVNERGQEMHYRPANRHLRRVGKWLIGWMPRLPIDPYPTRITTVARVSVDRLRINHYVVKTRGDWMDKATRFREGRGDGRNSPKYNETFYRYHDRNDVYDPIARRWLPQVRELLG